MKDNKKILIIALIVIIVLSGIVLAVKIATSGNNEQEVVEEVAQTEEVPEEEVRENVNIFSGDSRPIAVMIDNHKGAWPQAGLNDTYLVYEIIVEGGETRLMALFKGKKVDVVGPVRSSRHYFLDYAMENDAIYAHYGWSPKAKNDISSLEINNINGIYYGKPTFWRISAKKAPHNAMTSTKTILDAAKKKGYNTTSKATSVLTYAKEEVELEEGESATEVKIPHSYISSCLLY